MAPAESAPCRSSHLLPEGPSCCVLPLPGLNVWLRGPIWAAQICPIRSGPTLMILSDLNCFPRDPSSKCSHTGGINVAPEHRRCEQDLPLSRVQQKGSVFQRDDLMGVLVIQLYSSDFVTVSSYQKQNVCTSSSMPLISANVCSKTSNSNN